MTEFIAGLVIGCCGALLLMGLLSTAREDDNDG